MFTPGYRIKDMGLGQLGQQGLRLPERLKVVRLSSAVSET